MRRGVLAVPTSALRIALFVLLLCARTAAADDPNALAGTWNGVLVKDGDPLAVTMSFSRSGTRWTGTFGSDAQQAAGIPLSRITATGSAIHFELRGDDGTTVFDGTVRRDGASGTWYCTSHHHWWPTISMRKSGPGGGVVMPASTPNDQSAAANSTNPEIAEPI